LWPRPTTTRRVQEPAGCHSIVNPVPSSETSKGAALPDDGPPSRIDRLLGFLPMPGM
jgi:hypothetical protein